MNVNPRSFISYSREDLKFALRLARDLEAAGVSVWLDKFDIPPGRSCDREIEQALEKCGEMIVILSPAAVSSENVLNEVAFALDKRKAIIPVICSECQTPPRLQRLHHVDFQSDYESGLKSPFGGAAPGTEH